MWRGTAWCPSSALATTLSWGEIFRKERTLVSMASRCPTTPSTSPRSSCPTLPCESLIKNSGCKPGLPNVKYLLYFFQRRAMFVGDLNFLSRWLSLQRSVLQVRAKEVKNRWKRDSPTQRVWHKLQVLGVRIYHVVSSHFVLGLAPASLPPGDREINDVLKSKHMDGAAFCATVQRLPSWPESLPAFAVFGCSAVIFHGFPSCDQKQMWHWITIQHQSHNSRHCSAT